MVVTAIYTDSPTGIVISEGGADGYTISGGQPFSTIGTQIPVTISYTYGGVTRTATVYVTVTQAEGTGSVGIKEPSIEFDGSSFPAGGQSTNFIITPVEANGPFTSYQWRVDGVLQEGITTSNFAVDLAKFSAGIHWVTVAAKKGNVWYSSKPGSFTKQ
jgi:hypothetical protein